MSSLSDVDWNWWIDFMQVSAPSRGLMQQQLFCFCLLLQLQCLAGVAQTLLAQSLESSGQRGFTLCISEDDVIDAIA